MKKKKKIRVKLDTWTVVRAAVEEGARFATNGKRANVLFSSTEGERDQLRELIENEVMLALDQVIDFD